MAEDKSDTPDKPEPEESPPEPKRAEHRTPAAKKPAPKAPAPKKDKPQKDAADRGGTESRGPNASRGPDVKTVRLIVGGLIAIVAVVIVGIVLLGGDDDSGSSDAPSVITGQPVGLSEDQLEDVAETFPHPIYWVGDSEDASQFELTKTEDNRVFIRYLTGDAQVGDPSPGFLTVGTYELPDAAAALKEAASTGSQELGDGDGFQTLTGGDKGNAYVVFDDQPDLQIEVYSPEPGKADDLVSSGAVEPVD